MVSIRLALVLMFMAFASQAQVNRYMVFFKDKTGTPFSITSPENFLSERALERRSRQGIDVIAEDLPVTPAYVDDVRNAGATVLYKTKWMNGVLVECTAAQVPTLQALGCVSSVQLVAPGARPSSGGRISASKKFKDTDGTAAASDGQLSMIGIDAMHTAGYHGEGMLVAILDAGFINVNVNAQMQHIFNESRFDATTSYNFVSGNTNVFSRNNHGANVWSIMGAYNPGVYVGGVYKAKFIVFITEDVGSEYRIEEYNWVFAAERADSAGADVINTSLGYRDFDDNTMDYAVADLDGETAVITRGATIASNKGIAVVVSAGNEGQGSPSTIGAPADAESVLSIGGVNSSGILWASSSIGPTADGRIKPDVVTQGDDVSFVNINGAVSSGDGTSYASPLAASLVTGLWQMMPDLTVKQLFDTLRGRSSQSNNPDNLLGYGIPNFVSVITAIEDAPADIISVFPNPATNQLKIEFPVSIPENQLKFDLVDAKGAVSYVRVSAKTDREYLVDLTGQKPGLYLIRCKYGSRYSVHKILKVE